MQHMCMYMYINKMVLAPVNRFMKTTKTTPSTPKASLTSDMQGMWNLYHC